MRQLTRWEEKSQSTELEKACSHQTPSHNEKISNNMLQAEQSRESGEADSD